MDPDLMGPTSQGQAVNDRVAIIFCGRKWWCRNCYSRFLACGLLWISTTRRRVVGYSSEKCLRTLATCSRSIQPKYGRNLKNALLAFHHSILTIRKPAPDPSNVLLPHAPTSQLIAHLLSALTGLSNEHDTTGQPIQPIARQWVESIPSLRPHDLDHRVELVSPSGMHRHARWLVDDNHVFVLMYSSDVLSSDWRLMPVESMRNNIPVLDNRGWVDTWIAVDSDLPTFYRVLVILPIAVSELRREDI